MRIVLLQRLGGRVSEAGLLRGLMGVVVLTGVSVGCSRAQDFEDSETHWLDGKNQTHVPISDPPSAKSDGGGITATDGGSSEHTVAPQHTLSASAEMPMPEPTNTGSSAQIEEPIEPASTASAIATM